MRDLPKAFGEIARDALVKAGELVDEYIAQENPKGGEYDADPDPKLEAASKYIQIAEKSRTWFSQLEGLPPQPPQEHHVYINTSVPLIRDADPGELETEVPPSER